jgi:hypothetical protein
MTSQVQIAKMALAHFGDRFDIASITEQSTEAIQMNLFYENAVRSVLRRHAFKFANFWTCPTYLTSPTTEPESSVWDYMFTYPPDAVRILKVVNPLGNREDPVPFDIGQNSAGVKVILCNEETPEIQYTKYLSDPSYFDDYFVMALSYRLASMACLGLTGDAGLSKSLHQLYEQELQIAAALSASEGVDPVRPESELIKARR